MVRKVLFLAANPIDSSRLGLDKEFRDIDEGLRRSTYRDRFELKSGWEVRSLDFYRHIVDVKPNIIHFSGHGAGSNGIELKGDDGWPQLVPTEALVNLFKLFADQGLECVVLNACFSEVQADEIVQYVPYVIGMSKKIGDEAAIVFAVAFYDALGAGYDIEFAFKLACTAIQLAGIPEHLTPVLKKNLKITNQNSSFNLKPMANSKDKERLEKRITSIENLLLGLDEKIASLESAEITAAHGTTFHITQELKKCRQQKQDLEIEREDLKKSIKEIGSE